ncbi:MAG: dihydroxyacetone kinase subunit L [Planctomycetes bacterium]|nr:dihydroxyacetone kinase subunit L [Planctomycetota bacterium]
MSEVNFDMLCRIMSSAVGKIRDNHEELTKLDSAIGDGDHGTTMLRSMESVDTTIAEASGDDVKGLLYDIGWNIMCCDGGSTGPLLGSLFMGMSDGVEVETTLDADAVAAMFRAGLEGMSVQSKANVGDKTMMDALIPAVEALEAASKEGKTIAEMFEAAAIAAKQGAESTKDMQAKFGRARNLGERTLGFQDPGATSISYIFAGFAEAINV